MLVSAPDCVVETVAVRDESDGLVGIALVAVMGLVELVTGISVDTFWNGLYAELASKVSDMYAELTNPQYSMATCSDLLWAVLAAIVVGIFLPSNPSLVAPAKERKVGARSV